MNKEEFKQTVMRQLNDKHSSFRYLMQGYGRAGTRYAARKHFYCSEFNLDVFIERLDDDDSFQVSFVDGGFGITETEQPVAMDLSDAREFGKMVYAVEELDITNDAITFGLRRFYLTVDNYMVSRIHHKAWPNETVTLRFKNGKFVLEGDVEKYMFLSMADRIDYQIAYRDYQFISDELARIARIDWGRACTIQMSEAIVNVFRTAGKNTSSSRCNRMLELLMTLTNYKKQ